MGSAAQHREKAEHNQAFLDSISDDYPDWLTTVAFYVAVELIETLAAERGCHNRNHEDRKHFVRRNCRQIFQAYHSLYNAGLEARYEPRDHALPADEVRSDLIERRLSHIRKYVASHTKPAEK